MDLERPVQLQSLGNSLLFVVTASHSLLDALRSWKNALLVEDESCLGLYANLPLKTGRDSRQRPRA